MTNKKQAILAISGQKNAGKTTLIERVLPYLTAEGLAVAVIKHDGHRFTPDVENTDTYRHFAAGAYGTAIFDGEKAMWVKRGTLDETYLIQMFPEADLILLEGFKYSHYPKMELLTHSPLCDPKTVLALIGDLPPTLATLPVFSRDAIQEIANFILAFVKGVTQNA